MIDKIEKSLFVLGTIFLTMMVIIPVIVLESYSSGSLVITESNANELASFGILYFVTLLGCILYFVIVNYMQIFSWRKEGLHNNDKVKM